MQENASPSMSRHPEIEVARQIYALRNEQVMLDYDLAKIYEIDTKVLKQAVRRNLRRFPSDFMFELTKVELESLRSQIVTLRSDAISDTKHDGHNEQDSNRFSNPEHFIYAPFAFTESGIGMLSSVLHSDRAIQVNIEIMRVIRQLRSQRQLPQIESEQRLDSLERRFDATDRKLDQVIDILCRQDLTPCRPSEIDRVRQIQEAVARQWKITVEDLKSSDRAQSFAMPRHIAIYLVRKQTDLSLNEIGRHFGGRDHATILSAIRKIERLSSITAMLDSITRSIQ